jgi:hypothetical protein
VRSILATSALLVVTILVAPVAALAAPPDPATAALAYLAGQQGADGSIAASAGPTEDFILGAAAAGYDPNALTSCGGTGAYAYLATKVASETAAAGGTAKLILAVLAGKLDPTAFGGNLVAHLGTFLNGTTGAFGDGSTFGQSLSILALKGDGQAIPAAAVTELRGLQDTDGSWNYQAAANSTGGDSNSTAIAIEALVAAGLPASDASMTKALAYLHTQQNTDGGFTYTAPGPSDPDSDAVVIQALVALGENPTGATWTVGGKTVMDDLLARQSPNGGFTYPGNSGPDAFTTSMVPAGLKGVPLPGTTTWTADAKIPGVTCAQAATPTPGQSVAASSAPIPTEPPTSALAGPSQADRGVPAVALLAGTFALALLASPAIGARRRRRPNR